MDSGPGEMKSCPSVCPGSNAAGWVKPGASTRTAGGTTTSLPIQSAAHSRSASMAVSNHATALSGPGRPASSHTRTAQK